MYQLEDFIYTKFIVRDNGDGPPRVGILKGYYEHENSGSSLPIVEIEGEDHLCFSSLVPYSTEMWDLLHSLSPENQWDFLLKIKHWNNAHSRKCR